MKNILKNKVVLNIFLFIFVIINYMNLNNIIYLLSNGEVGIRYTWNIKKFLYGDDLHGDYFVDPVLNNNFLKIICLIISIIIIIITILYVLYYSYIKKNYSKKNTNKLDNDLIKNEVFRIYKIISESIMNFDFVKLKELLSDNLYKKYENELLKLEKDNNQRILKEFKIYSFEVINEKKKNNTLTILMGISLYDYIINKETNSIIDGDDNKKVINNYRFIFKEIDNKWIVEDIYLISSDIINKKNVGITHEEINSFIPNINAFELEKGLYNEFINIKEAYMNFNYPLLKKLCSENIYNIFYDELEKLKNNNSKNIIKDFAKIEDRIIDVSSNNDIVTIDYYLDVKFYDYVINTKTNKIEKGNDKYKLHNIYRLTFTKSNKENNICPNCGAHIESGSTKCSHCKAVIVKDSSEFVLSEKRKIG